MLIDEVTDFELWEYEAPTSGEDIIDRAKNPDDVATFDAPETGSPLYVKGDPYGRAELFGILGQRIGYPVSYVREQMKQAPSHPETKTAWAMRMHENHAISFPHLLLHAFDVVTGNTNLDDQMYIVGTRYTRVDTHVMYTSTYRGKTTPNFISAWILGAMHPSQ